MGNIFADIYQKNTGCTAEVSGYELQNSGIRVRIASSLSSELLILREK